MWSDLTLGPPSRSNEDSQTKSAYNSLVIGTRGFGALSLRWIQFASVLRCARSSYYMEILINLMIKQNKGSTLLTLKFSSFIFVCAVFILLVFVMCNIVC